MILNWETIKAAFKGYRALYRQALMRTTFTWQKLAMEAPSTGPAEDYNWLGAIPQVSEWVGDKQAAQLRAFKFTITNKDWEATLEVDRNEFEDDKLGMVRPRIQQLPFAVKTHMDKLINELGKDGFAALCYDGQYFFDTDHSEGDSGTQSNKGTTAISKLAIEATIAAGMKIKNDRGDYIGILYDTICVPPDLFFSAQEYVKAATIVVAGSTDTVRGAHNFLSDMNIQVLANPYLSDANDWMMYQTAGALRPFIMQIRKAPDFVELSKPDNEIVFFKRKLYFGLEARYNVGYGLWQLAYGHSVT